MSISPDDRLSRCLIYPKMFKDYAIVDSQLFLFGASSDDGASHESGVLRSVAVADAEVHATGCGIAATQNERGGLVVGVQSPKRRFYVGFRTAYVRDLALKGPGYEVRLTPDNENGQRAHVDIALFVDPGDSNRRKTIKAEAGLALAEIFGEATGHICPVDADDQSHPLRINPNCLNPIQPIAQLTGPMRP